MAKFVYFGLGTLMLLASLFLGLITLSAMATREADASSAFLVLAFAGFLFIIAAVFFVFGIKKAIADSDNKFVADRLKDQPAGDLPFASYSRDLATTKPQGSVIPPSVFNALPSIVRYELPALPQHTANAFVEEYYRKRKSTGVAYLLWFFLGFHYLYMGKWVLQLLFFFTAGGFFLWWFIDLFRVPGIVSDYNKDVAVSTLATFRAIAR